MSTMDNRQDEYGNDFITLTDDDGAEFELEHLDTLEHNGSTYMAFIPAEMSLSDEYELMILKLEPNDETGDELLVTVDDESELDEVFELFSERLESTFEDDDTESEEEELKKEGY